jgi:DNA-binding transcriptional ArsR family regulator
MKFPKADLILHPVRMRIIMALAGRQMTPRQLSAAMPDVAPATLYRHLKAMTEGGVLAVVDEHAVRGTLEKVYALAQPEAAHLSEGDLAGADRDDWMRLFTAFVVTLLGDFARYLERENLRPAADGLGFHKYPVYMSDEEFAAFARALSELLLPYFEAAPGRQRRLFSLIIMPEDGL